MANHKRGKPKNARAGCLMCKPHKANGAKDAEPLQELKAEAKLDEGLEEVVESEFQKEIRKYCSLDFCGCGECSPEAL
jgi:hypothetical protein